MSKKNKKVMDDQSIEVLENENVEMMETEDKKWKFIDKDSKVVAGAKKIYGGVKKNGKKIVFGVAAGAVLVGTILYEISRSKDDGLEADDYVTLDDTEDDVESVETPEEVPFDEKETEISA